MRWVEHVEHMPNTKNAHKILAKKMKGRDYLGDLDINGTIVSK
jgi:hypothetical protein